MSIRDKALNATVVSPLMRDREKGTLSKIFDKEVTLREYDIVELISKQTGELQPVAVMIFDEYPDNFYFGGVLATKIVSKFDDSDRAELLETGLKIKFSAGKSKKTGNNLTLVTII